jgi:hypothetical protein
MNAPDVKGSFSNSAKAALLALTMATMPFVPANDVQAQQPQVVQSVKFASNAARGDNFLSRAGDYSKGRKVVGIAITVGGDVPSHVTLQQVGELAKAKVESFKAPAEYFVERNPNPNAGTSMMYFIDGEPWSNAMSYREGLDKAETVAAEAWLTFMTKKETLASAPQATLQR